MQIIAGYLPKSVKSVVHNLCSLCFEICGYED